MTKHEIVQYLTHHGIVAIIRADGGGDDLVRCVEALAAGGVRCIEITLTTPGALEAIEAASKRLAGADVLLGAGSVVDGASARLAILAGARYIVSPITSQEVIRMAHRHGAAVLPGAFTPTEIFQAWEWGADIVKVFPATLGGLDYIKAVRAPLPQIPLCPTGGIDLDNIDAFIDAGVAAVGIGSNLVSKKLLAAEDWDGLRENAARYAAAWAARRG